MKITIGQKTFVAVLYDNPTALAFQSLLPFTLDMEELNGNEKYADVPENLPVRSSHPGQIKAGDLMMYGSGTLVLFYKSFPTTYSYTPIGRIADIHGLEEALGKKKVTISLEP